MSKVITQSTAISVSSGILHDTFSAPDPVLAFFSDYLLAVFIVILSIFLIIAKLATKILTTSISRFASHTKIKWDNHLSDLLRRPVFWSLILSGLLISIIPFKLSVNAAAIFQPVPGDFVPG
jgi:hypothetical protein